MNLGLYTMPNAVYLFEVMFIGKLPPLYSIALHSISQNKSKCLHVHTLCVRANVMGQWNFPNNLTHLDLSYVFLGQTLFKIETFIQIKHANNFVFICFWLYEIKYQKRVLSLLWKLKSKPKNIRNLTFVLFSIDIPKI